VVRRRSVVNAQPERGFAQGASWARAYVANRAGRGGACLAGQAACCLAHVHIKQWVDGLTVCEARGLLSTVARSTLPARTSSPCANAQPRWEL